ncbi:hypothetical protein GLOTRDRAFT_40800, partial [Gloeophyllum trabeum ATCC 11539]
AILATEFNNFEKGAAFQKRMKSVLGTGVFNSDGNLHRTHSSQHTWRLRFRRDVEVRF